MPNLSLSLADVSKNSNCSGCGACALAFREVDMRMDPSTGFLRPVVEHVDDNKQSGDDVVRLDEICPGSGSVAPRDERPFDRHFGPYLSVWRAWATDPEVRYAGSSGGAVTALVDWILRSGESSKVAAVTAGGPTSISSRGVMLATSEEAVDAAGSRYFPASALAAIDPAERVALVGKPCEVAGLRKIEKRHGSEPALTIAVFCAGTPSFHATERAIADLGATSEEVKELRYRGRGWPGRFTTLLNDDTERSMSYSRAWSAFLGRDIDGLCRICVDGTGMHADLSVGDFWRTDARGYPLFTEAAGESAVIARTPRGEALLLSAAAVGLLHLEKRTINDVRAVQPAQVSRSNSLWARIASRRILGMRTPTYSGYRLRSLAISHPASTVRFFVGTMKRLIAQRPR